LKKIKIKRLNLEIEEEKVFNDIDAYIEENRRDSYTRGNPSC